MNDNNWFRRAVFYEVLVRAFQDSNADGIGDIPGLISRLDYLEWLGVDCIWLLPINESPLLDGGYDVADYRAILPSYGTVEDVGRLLQAAHARGMRVIADLVMNHTSSAHPWFQSARSSPDSPYRDWYVWSEGPDKYKEARIIFCDTEPSNWAWDEEAGAYYWHRFFSHQPDLNYDHPEVREAMFDVARFWLQMGMDGFRLDAVPYLYEREGTNGENLPETHGFLADLRDMVDREFPGTLLLAEANQWPVEAAAYFGTLGRPECHMNFHFPLMPRLFMSLKREDGTAIVDVLNKTPPPPPDGAWGGFLRNHDELTLEMVTPEEREYMWAVYAPDPRMKLNLGIRRRLAPLLGDSRDKLELMYSLLMSLPGAPFLYYGDEIGMGDNIELPDRDGVRTPMQWSGGRSAGFSQASEEVLYLPLITDSRYGYRTRNVEAERAKPESWLNWVRSLIALRKSVREFTDGDFHVVDSANRAVLAFLRTGEKRSILCVNNLSASQQRVQLNLSGLEGSSCLEIRVTGAPRGFSAVGSQPYRLELGPHEVVWLALTR